MGFYKGIILGLLQGFTEFLPVSSSGHLVLVQKLFRLSPPVFFDILVHFGTLLAIILFFFEEFSRLRSKKTWTLLVVASLPAVVVGFFIRNKLERIFDSYLLLGLSFLITAFLLFSTRFLKFQKKEIKRLSYKDAFLIGCFQALALLPGVSRSGSTLVAGLLVGLKKQAAFVFAFFMAIPAVIGALTLEILENGMSDNLKTDLSGSFTAFLSGLLALYILKRVLKGERIFLFGFYCLILGVTALFLSFTAR